ncbi:MAG: ribosome maturation factor RimM [Deltaproteobacteria bacterium]|nr:ribosome maturation factor RimM [Deltaproteobacteria bacterium]
MMNLEGIRQIGRITNTHGLKGDLKIMPLSSEEGILQRIDHILIEQDGQPKSLKIKSAKPHKSLWLVRFLDYDEISQVENFKGKDIYLEESCLTPLEPDEYYIDDLIGAKVYSLTDEYLGVITDYFETAGQGVCEVEDEKRSFLFPATKEVLKDFDSEKKTVRINLLEGLIE